MNAIPMINASIQVNRAKEIQWFMKSDHKFWFDGDSYNLIRTDSFQSNDPAVDLAVRIALLAENMVDGTAVFTYIPDADPIQPLKLQVVVNALKREVVVTVVS